MQLKQRAVGWPDNRQTMGRAGRQSDAPRPLKCYEATIMGCHKLPFPEVHRNPPLIRVDRARLRRLLPVQ